MKFFRLKIDFLLVKLSNLKRRVQIVSLQERLSVGERAQLLGASWRRTLTLQWNGAYSTRWSSTSPQRLSRLNCGSPPSPPWRLTRLEPSL